MFNPEKGVRNVRPLARRTFPLEMKSPSMSLLAANYPHMNFTQMHERLRLELLRRINRGTLSVSLLARQTGFGQAHLSNFLHNRRQLSLQALDRVMAAQHLAADDLLPNIRNATEAAEEPNGTRVPIVAHAGALFEPYIRPSVVHAMLHLPNGFLQSLQARASKPRRAWQRFVAMRISQGDSQAMNPLVSPEAIALIDRHYNSLTPYRPDRPNTFAVRSGAQVLLRHADFQVNRLVLSPHNRSFPVELLELGPHESPGDLIAGRVALILNEI
jgi:hypothetical protein